MWGLALLGTIVLGARRLPELTPFVAALYVCTGFFGHAYTIAWRARAGFWQATTWMIAMFLHSSTMAIQADHAGARVVHYAGGVGTRPPDPRLFVPVALSIGCVALLVLHATWLGTGSRAPRPTAPADDASDDDLAERLTATSEPDRLAPERPSGPHDE